MTDPSDGFANIEDRGRSLFVRVTRPGGRGSVPAVISREALEDHFGAGDGDKDLASAYLAHQEAINAKVFEFDPLGSVYTTDYPMLLGANDFG